MSEVEIYMGRPKPKWAHVTEAGPDELGKKCSDCKRYLTVDSFHNNRSKWDGKACECRECKWRAQARNWDKWLANIKKSKMRAGTRPFLESERDARKRLEEFAATGAASPRPSEQAAAARLKAFAEGVDVYEHKPKEED